MYIHQETDTYCQLGFYINNFKSFFFVKQKHIHNLYMFIE